MKLMSIASSSSGNCIYVASDNTAVLIDAGISKKKVLEGMSKRGLSMEDVKAVFVTHEHSDHIKSLRTLSKRTSAPIYASQGTLDAIIENYLPSLAQVAQRRHLLSPRFSSDPEIRHSSV